MNKTSSNEISNWKSMSRTLYPINTRTTFWWTKAKGIFVKWRNCLKREGRGRRSPATNCSLVKYIALLGWSAEDRVSSSIRWIGILSRIWNRAQNSCSNRKPTRHFDIKCPTLVFCHPLLWGLLLPLLKATPPFTIMLSGYGSCGNLHWITQLSKSVTRPNHLSVMP